VASEDGRTLVLRIATWGGAPLSFSLRIAAPVPPGVKVEIFTLRGESGAVDEENTPGEPERIAPRCAATREYEPGMLFELPDLSFTVLTLTLHEPLVAAQ
jgi:hypothetical protein